MEFDNIAKNGSRLKKEYLSKWEEQAKRKK